MKKFKLTEDHIKLAQRMYLSWQNAEYGAPAIDPKRPYGNSDVEKDIASILNWKVVIDNDGYSELSNKQIHKAFILHGEMETALQIILCCKTFKPGVFEQQESYSALSWKRVKEKK